MPAGWLEAEPFDVTRLSNVSRYDGFLSLTKGTSREAEFPDIHRLRQAIYVADDYVKSVPTFDHFAAPMLIATLLQFADALKVLKSVKGASERIQRLWAGPSNEVDSVFMEILTASACASKGRDIEFITEASEKTPDIRCYDPFPIVIKCKRQRAISDYELDEESVMRQIFVRLRAEARSSGVSGRFRPNLEVEATAIDPSEIATALVALRTVSNPERVKRHPWGFISFEELPSSVSLSRPTRLYSPNLLREVFLWNSDIATYDGLCCTYANASDLVNDRVVGPLALIWNNSSEAAIRKRSWAPNNLFASAFDQIPLGEDGIIYVALHEGARAEMADRRVQAFQDRLKDFNHRAGIRVPIAILSRLLPRALVDGRPDLIENGLQLYSNLYGDPDLFSMFPTLIFTKTA